MTNKQVILEIVQSNIEGIEINELFDLMFLEYKLSAPKTHNIILELEEAGEVKTLKNFSGYSYDNYDKKIANYDYFIMLK